MTRAYIIEIKYSRGLVLRMDLDRGVLRGSCAEVVFSDFLFFEAPNIGNAGVWLSGSSGTAISGINGAGGSSLGGLGNLPPSMLAIVMQPGLIHGGRLVKPM
jgi:hypothetical protein